MDFFRFLFSRRFLKHLLLVAGTGAILIWFVSLWLNWYTRHKDYIVVPDLKGKRYSEVTAEDQYRDFQFVLMDSVYEQGAAPGTIVSQEPLMNSKVKHNRKIYLTVVSSLPDMVAMPDLKFLTLRQATSMLESYGLKMGTLSYTRSFDQDAVQEQYFEGKPVKPGTRLYKGSIVDLMVGLGAKGMPAREEGGNDEEGQDTLADEP